MTAVVYLSLAPVVQPFDPTRAARFVPEGIGFLAGIGLYLTRYWRRAYYPVAIAVALAAIVAFFAIGGRWNAHSSLAKAAEVVFVLVAGCRYWAEGRAAAD